MYLLLVFKSQEEQEWQRNGFFGLKSWIRETITL